MKFISLFFAIFLTVNQSQAGYPVDDPICNTNKYCKEVCELKADGEYSDYNTKHQKLVLECASGIVKQ